MSFLTNLKQAFGLGTPPTVTPPEANPTDNGPGATRIGLPPTPQQRETLYRFIVEKLAAYSNETDALPVGLTLWIRCADASEEDRMAVALYAGQPGHFQAELSRHLADQYIKLAPDWQLNWQFVHDALPTDCTYRQDNLGLEVIRPATSQPLKARIRTLTGQTTEDSYLLDPAVQTEFRIGRGQTAQTASGRVRTNDIAFLDADERVSIPSGVSQTYPSVGSTRPFTTTKPDVAIA